jgi:hypothetical protein
VAEIGICIGGGVYCSSQKPGTYPYSFGMAQLVQSWSSLDGTTTPCYDVQMSINVGGLGGESFHTTHSKEAEPHAYIDVQRRDGAGRILAICLMFILECSDRDPASTKDRSHCGNSFAVTATPNARLLALTYVQRSHYNYSMLPRNHRPPRLQSAQRSGGPGCRDLCYPCGPCADPESTPVYRGGNRTITTFAPQKSTGSHPRETVSFIELLSV